MSDSGSVGGMAIAQPTIPHGATRLLYPRNSGRAYNTTWRCVVANDVQVRAYSDFEDRLQPKAAFRQPLDGLEYCFLSLTLGAFRAPGTVPGVRPYMEDAWRWRQRTEFVWNVDR